MIKGLEGSFQFRAPGPVIKGRSHIQQNEGSAKNTEADNLPGVTELAGTHDQGDGTDNAEQGAHTMGGTV